VQSSSCVELRDFVVRGARGAGGARVDAPRTAASSAATWGARPWRMLDADASADSAPPVLSQLCTCSLRNSAICSSRSSLRRAASNGAAKVPAAAAAAAAVESREDVPADAVIQLQP
jgi:hypothetical protein